MVGLSALLINSAGQIANGIGLKWPGRRKGSRQLVQGHNVKITLKELKKQTEHIEQLVVESVDLSLYIAHARINGEERVIAEDERKILKRRNLLEMKRVLKTVAGCEILLRQRSAYDEMVGHSHPAAANTLEISLGDAPLPEWLN